MDSQLEDGQEYLDSEDLIRYLKKLVHHTSQLENTAPPTRSSYGSCGCD